MIRINLLPVKKKKASAKPLPVFAVSAAAGTLAVIAVLLYMFFYFDSKLKNARARVEENRIKIAELKNRIKEVDNFEKLNKSFSEKNGIIEQLRKKQNTPVIMLDSIGANLPNGVWLNSLIVTGDLVNIDGYAFTNSDVVQFVDNLKQVKAFADVSLQESRETEIEKIMLYRFRLALKVVV